MGFIEQPSRQIERGADGEPSVGLNNDRDGMDDNGFRDTYSDMLDVGILDPVNVMDGLDY